MVKVAKKIKDCPAELISLVDKPRAWRFKATEVLIEFGNDIKMLKRECAAVIGLAILILGVLAKLAIG